MEPYPRLSLDLPPEVAEEVRSAYLGGRPWTKIRVLRNPSEGLGKSCGGSLGNHHEPCSEKVEAIQYSTAFGDPIFFCEKHALLQNEWDRTFYESKPKPIRQLPEDHYDDVKKLLQRLDRKKRKKEQESEVDPTA